MKKRNIPHPNSEAVTLNTSCAVFSFRILIADLIPLKVMCITSFLKTIAALFSLQKNRGITFCCCCLYITPWPRSVFWSKSSLSDQCHC